MTSNFQIVYEHLVKVGEPISFGKNVIIARRPDTYWGEDRKVFYEKTLEAVKQLGFEIVDPDEIFRCKCWYSEDDERTLKMLEDGEVYRCLSFFGHYSPEFNVSFYYVRKETASSTSAVADLKEIEREKINAQLKRAKDIVKEKSAEEMRKWAQEKTYYQRTKEFSENEQLVFDVLVLSGCSSTYLEKLNLKKWNGESDFVNYVKNNQADRHQWYRAFIAECLSSNNVNFYSYLQKCQKILFAEQYPDDFKALSKKLADSYDKKEKKLKERLKELNNDNTEEA